PGHRRWPWRCRPAWLGAAWPGRSRRGARRHAAGRRSSIRGNARLGTGPGEGKPPPVKGVIADDSLFIREGLARPLADAGVEVTATAADVPQLLDELDKVPFDAVIVDIRMPPTFTTEGIDAAHTIRDAFPGKGIVVLSQFLESGYASQLL